MASRDGIIKFCEDYLRVSEFSDGCKNGLQVEGKEEVKKIVTGVSLSQELIEKALEKGADMIMVHHGLNNSRIMEEAVQIKGFTRRRLKALLTHDLNLAGFHLPLDAHPEIGNNISLAREFGLKNISSFDIGFIGSLEAPLKFQDFVSQVKEKLKTSVYTISAGPDHSHRVAIISGGASPRFESALEQGADTYISGDIREGDVRAMEESGINFINAWHYNTERLGVFNLGNLVAEKFGIEVEFVDIPCDV